jgi:hypothetical protein
MVLRKIITVYTENHTKPVNTLCRQNAELLNVETDGKRNVHSEIKPAFFWAHLRIHG